MFAAKEPTVNQLSRHQQPIKQIPAMTWRSRVAVVAVAAVMVAGCSSTGSTAGHGPAGSPATSTSTTAAPAAAHGVEAPMLGAGCSPVRWWT
jgi:hypothetical protein